MIGTLQPPFIIPTTEAPSQTINITLGGQACRINLYTKSINAPIVAGLLTDPPSYENINPVFLDLFRGDTPIVGGVLCRTQSMIVMNTYFGFVGDLSMIDTSGANEDPFGVPALLPPPSLRNEWQRRIPLRLGGRAPSNLAGKIPGLGTRFVLTYWPNLK